MQRSRVAVLIENHRDVRDRSRPEPWGLCIHQTGRGIVERAKQSGADPLSFALSFYAGSPAFAHYLIGWKGETFQIALDNERAPHAGISRRERKLYRSGAWKKKVSPAALDLWQRRWPFQDPTELYPTTSPNDSYLGVELLPLADRTFTDAQYRALVALWRDIEDRHGIDLLDDGRLVGHEDIEPLSRWNKGGGWDPGALRRKPRFSLTHLIEGYVLRLGPSAFRTII